MGLKGESNMKAKADVVDPRSLRSPTLRMQYDFLIITTCRAEVDS